MKKYLKIFSVVICSIFIFSNKINALEESNLNIDFNLYIDYFKNIEEIDYLKEIENMSIFLEENIKDFNYIFKIVCQANNEICGFDIQFYSKDIDNFYINDNYSENTFTIEAINNNDSKYLNWKRYQFNIEDMEEIKNQIIEFIKNPKWQNINTPKIPQIYQFQVENIENNYQNKIINDGSSFILMINTNFDLKFNNVSNTDNIYNLYVNNKKINNNDNIPQFIDYLNKENPLKYRTSFNNDMNIDLDKITFDYSSAEYIDGSIKVLSKVSVSNYVTDSEKFPKFIDLDFKGHYSSGPGGGTTIEYDLNDYFTYDFSVVDEVSYYDYIFEFKLIKDLPHEYMRITVTYDFETFDNDYYFDLYDNCRYATFYDYIATFLNGYRKYTFPVDYDLAIIRSKSFEDLESFFISGKLDFEYALYDFKFFTYDFNNKKFNYNYFNYEDYLINEDYFKFPLKIDETNNIFPVIFNSRTDITSSFYLKDDLFVEFINSDTLDSYLDNITNDEFNQNNDLEIDVSFSTDVDINLDNSSVDFHDSFTFSLDYFKDSIKTIFLVSAISTYI